MLFALVTLALSIGLSQHTLTNWLESCGGCCTARKLCSDLSRICVNDILQHIAAAQSSLFLCQLKTAIETSVAALALLVAEEKAGLGGLLAGFGGGGGAKPSLSSLADELGIALPELPPKPASGNPFKAPAGDKPNLSDLAESLGLPLPELPANPFKDLAAQSAAANAAAKAEFAELLPALPTLPPLKKPVLPFTAPAAADKDPSAPATPAPPKLTVAERIAASKAAAEAKKAAAAAKRAEAKVSAKANPVTQFLSILRDVSDSIVSARKEDPEASSTDMAQAAVNTLLGKFMAKAESLAAAPAPDTPVGDAVKPLSVGQKDGKPPALAAPAGTAGVVGSSWENTLDSKLSSGKGLSAADTTDILQGLLGDFLFTSGTQDVYNQLNGDDY